MTKDVKTLQGNTNDVVTPLSGTLWLRRLHAVIFGAHGVIIYLIFSEAIKGESLDSWEIYAFISSCAGIALCSLGMYFAAQSERYSPYILSSMDRVKLTEIAARAQEKRDALQIPYDEIHLPEYDKYYVETNMISHVDKDHSVAIEMTKKHDKRSFWLTAISGILLLVPAFLLLCSFK